ncbi:hypothetical protein E4T44_13118 [Aureobasidium sp. EXF-8845]|nr:hypothetical protein E4T44_13118 [Aureobasidium sp. EXF-8845]
MPLRPLGSTPSVPLNQCPSAPLKNQSPSPRPNEGRQAPRSKSLDVVAEAQDDVDGSLKGLDQKQRQLDDQIHKSTIQKEQAIKLHERELRTRYAADSRQDARATEGKGHERESELPGFFTLAYLPLLESEPSGLDRSSSAPVLSDAADSRGILPDRQALQRADTDPASDDKSSLSRRGWTQEPLHPIQIKGEAWYSL